jgi:acyl-CoA synthetase (AMP-forming)/AMP-acid ligase II
MQATKPTQSYYYTPGEIAPGVTLGEHLERTANRFPDKKAFVFRETSVTWKELGLIVDRLVLALMDLGIKHGDKVAVLFPNRLEFIYAALALAKLGAVDIPISERLREREIRYILEKTEAVAIIMINAFWDFSFSDLMAGIKKDLPKLRHIIVSDKKSHPHEILLEDLIQRDWQKTYPEDIITESIRSNIRWSRMIFWRSSLPQAPPENPKVSCIPTTPAADPPWGPSAAFGVHPRISGSSWFRFHTQPPW